MLDQLASKSLDLLARGIFVVGSFLSFIATIILFILVSREVRQLRLG